jgi:hypothetical protein
LKLSCGGLLCKRRVAGIVIPAVKFIQAVDEWLTNHPDQPSVEEAWIIVITSNYKPAAGPDTAGRVVAAVLSVSIFCRQPGRPRLASPRIERGLAHCRGLG